VKHMSEGESIVALVVLGVIILVLSAILLTLCCLRRRRPGFTNEVLPEGLDEGEGQLAIGYTQELQRSAKFAEAPPKLSRKAVYDELHLDPAYKVTYVTDVEGNWEYFCSFVERADGLYWGSLAPGEFVPQLELREGWRFIFGGDAVDKGGAIGGSLRFCLCLVSLKRRYGDRVTILLGNRDLNKMRLTSELHPGQLGSAVLGALPGPKWIPEGPKRVTPEQYLRKLAAAALGVAPEEVTDAQLAERNTMANRLRYILRETMGADGELERRSSELQTLGAAGHDLAPLLTHALPIASSGEGAALDEAVASFVASVAPGGWMRELLDYGELGVLMGDSLFVHGGLLSRDFTDANEETDCFGHVPGRDDRIGNAPEWLLQLRLWKQRMITEWHQRPYWAEPAAAGAPPHNSRGGEGLMDYCIPKHGPTVVLGRHLDADSMPLPTPYSLMVRCNRAGISRLVVGHTPHGNCPTVIKTAEHDAHLEVVMNDTSYSDMKQPDNRGQACSEFILYPSCDARIAGILDDGAPYDYALGQDGGPPSELIGRVELSTLAKRKKNGEPQLRFVKAKMTTGDYLLCHVNGFKYEYEYMTEVDTGNAVGAVAALDELRESHSRLNPRALGVYASQNSNGPTSSRNGKPDWSCKIERPSAAGLP